MKSRTAVTYSITIAAWQISAFAIMLIYRRFFSPLLYAAYTHWFGSVQANYGAYERSMLYLYYLVVTASATLIGIVIFDRQRGMHPPARVRILAACGWTWATWSALIAAYENGITYEINQLFWKLFGIPNNLYSFRNLMLHRIVTWLLCSISTAVLAIWLYSRFTRATPTGFPIATRESTSTASDQGAL